MESAIQAFEKELDRFIPPGVVSGFRTTKPLPAAADTETGEIHASKESRDGSIRWRFQTFAIMRSFLVFIVPLFEALSLAQ